MPNISKSALNAPAKDSDWDDVEGALGAGWRGGLDAATLGLANKATAASSATWDAIQGKNWLQSYDGVRTNQQAQDGYDAVHHPIARQVGGALGTVAGLLATDGMTAGPVASARIASLAPRMLAPTAESAVRVLRPWAAAAGVGATTSVAGQGYLDALSGHFSSPQTYLANAAGGAVGGVATLARSPAAGAAADAAISGLTHAALTGQPVQVDDMEKSALLGSYIGLLGHVSGTTWADDLDWRDKGKLGDFLAERQSNILGDDVLGRQKYFKTSGGKTRVDHVTDKGKVEAKFGYSAALSDRQTEAFNQFPDYFVYHYLPDDVGKITGGLLAIGSTHVPQQKRH